MSFRSKPSFALGQFVKIAYAIEASNHSFLWVVRKTFKDEERYMLEGVFLWCAHDYKAFLG